MKNKAVIIYFLAITFPILILLAMSFLPVVTFFLGEEVFIETVPIDPKDVFRGDYVSLSYAINNVSADLFPEELKEESTFEKYRDKSLFAVLKKQEDFYVVEKITFTRPKDKPYLKADVNLYSVISWNPRDLVRVDYQIDRYFVPENTGRYLEDLAIKGELMARVKVWHGYPLLIELLPKAM